MAIRLANAPTEALEVLDDKAWRLDADRVGVFLRGRRATRVYRDERVDPRTIEQLIAIAQYAPSGHNTQPLSWTVISQPRDVENVAKATAKWMRDSLAQSSPYATLLNMQSMLATWDLGEDVICRNAPHMIIAHGPDSLPAGAHAAAIALTYLELAAVSRGLGTCWAGLVFVGAGISPELHGSLDLPNGQRCAGAILLGHPAVTYRRIPGRRAPSIHWR
jgi:nitroreductase